jgi:hypothetical protein
MLCKKKYSTYNSTITVHNISVRCYWIKRLPMNNTFSYTRTYVMQNTHHQQVVKATGNVNICIALQIIHNVTNCSISCVTIHHVCTWNNIQTMKFRKYNLRKLKSGVSKKHKGEIQWDMKNLTICGQNWIYITFVSWLLGTSSNEGNTICKLYSSWRWNCRLLVNYHISQRDAKMNLNIHKTSMKTLTLKTKVLKFT